MARALSLFEMDAFLRNAGAERVSENASRKLRDVLEDSAKDLLDRARVYARHAGRNRITRKDVLLAASLEKRKPQEMREFH